MRTVRSSLSVLVVAALACGVGCASLIGADFDRPAASAEDAGEASAANDVDGNAGAVDGGGTADADASLACEGSRCPGTWTVQMQDSTTGLTRIWGSGPHDIYAIGTMSSPGGAGPYTATIVHSVGDGSWTSRTPPVTRGVLDSIWGKSADDVYLGGWGELFHLGASGLWTGQDAGAGSHYAIWGSASNDVYTNGSESSILHSTGDGTWTAQATSKLGAGQPIVAMWGSGPTDVYALVYSSVGHSNGDGNWSTVFSAPGILDAIWGSASDDVYAVGDDGGVYHRGADGQWKTESTGAPSTKLRAVWGSGRGDVYIAGEGGVILHGKGDGSWTADVVPTHGDVIALWGSSQSDVYALSAPSVWASDPHGSLILHRTAPQ